MNTATCACVSVCLVSTLSLSPPGPLIQALKALFRIPAFSACRTPVQTSVCCQPWTEDFCGAVWHLGLNMTSCPWPRGKVFVVIHNYIILIFFYILFKSLLKVLPRKWIVKIVYFEGSVMGDTSYRK